MAAWLKKPPLPQPLKHAIAPNDNAAAASTTGRPGIFRSRLRTRLMPAIGSSSKATAIVPSDPPGFASRAVCGLMVWMVMVTGVAPLPAGIVAGEKVAVAPAGKPVALKVTASGKVDPEPGANVRLKAAAPPGSTVSTAEPALGVSVKPKAAAATVKLVVAVAAA